MHGIMHRGFAKIHFLCGINRPYGNDAQWVCKSDSDFYVVLELNIDYLTDYRIIKGIWGIHFSL